jgi:hypothetical protein
MGRKARNIVVKSIPKGEVGRVGLGDTVEQHW